MAWALVIGVESIDGQQLRRILPEMRCNRRPAASRVPFLQLSAVLPAAPGGYAALWRALKFGPSPALKES